LVAGGLIVVEPQGRRRFYQLAAPEVAAAVEALSYIAAPVPVRSLRQSDRAQALHEGRICYDHLAARLGVAVRDALQARQALGPLGGRDYDLTPSGTQLLAEVAVDVEEQRRRRRAFARGCLDWSHRRPHLAGALGAALLQAFLGRRWLRLDAHRLIRVDETGYKAMERWLSWPLRPGHSVGAAHSLRSPATQLASQRNRQAPTGYRP
jgi:hypothetical protein